MYSMHVPTESYVPPGSPVALVTAWTRRARESQFAHYAMADRLAARGQWLGVAVILISTLIGTSVFASIAAAEDAPTWAKLIVGCLSVMAAVMSALQTFFKFSERAERHRVFGARYGAVRRELEAFLASGTVDMQTQYIMVLREKLDRIAEEAPDVDNGVFDTVRQGLRHPEHPTNAVTA
ncbi:hypothetical protein BH10PSE17_BH10PSE17_23310 [soil metagenome]